MSNEARHNPRSAQYDGPLPENIFGVELFTAMEPTDEWRARNESDRKEAEAAGIQYQARCELEDQQVVARVRVVNVVPMRTVPQAQWPRVAIDLGMLMVADPATGEVRPARIAVTDLRKRSFELVKDQAPELAGVFEPKKQATIEV